MTKRLSEIMQEADAIIGGRADGHIKEASSAMNDEEILGLASYLQGPEVKQAASKVDEWSMSVTEKIAESLAITECLMNMDELVKTAKFEKEASAQGYSESEIEEFIEKRASTPGRFRSVVKLLPWLGGAAVAGGAGVKGYQKGKEGGYSEALKDVNQAMQEYAG